MVIDGKELSYSLVRKFVVDFYLMEMSDFILYSAIEAPKDAIWFQSMNSEEWQILNQNTTRHEIVNPSKYKWQFRFTMNSFVAAGASLLKAWEKQNKLSQGFASFTNGFKYRLLKEDGSL